MAGFGWAGAAAGASDELQEMLATRRAAFLQQEQLRMQQEAAQRQASQFDRQMRDRTEDRGLQQMQQEANNFDRTQQRERQAKLDATAASDRANLQGKKTMMGDFLTRRQPGVPLSDTERGSLEAMAVTDDIDLPASLTAKPTKRVVTTLGPRGGPVSKLVSEEEHEQGVPEYRAPTSTASDDALVKVDTMENGKRVTKWLPKSQVAGQTFESPSGGPTLASGQQRRILNFYNRMNDALGTVEGIEPATAKQGLAGKLQGQYAHNMLQTAEQQSYRQAQRAFTEARLRKESGAAIPPHEYENDAKTYFAQPGDDPATIAQKKQKRQALLESTAFEAGPAYEEFYSEPFKRTPQVDTNVVGQEFDWVNGQLVPRGAR